MNDQKTSGKNLTKRELEGLLDAGLAALRADSLDSATVSEAAARVQHQLGIESAPTQNEWQGCEDLRALIPLYLGKMSGEQLSPARVLLLEDHLSECVVCRRALREARGVRGSGQPSRPLPSPKRDRWQTIRGGGLRWSPPVRWAVAALLVGSLGLIGWTWWQRFVSPFVRLNPTVEAASGEIYRVSENQIVRLGVGQQVERGERLRTGREATALVRLDSGTTLEIEERSELTFRETREGVTLGLERGRVIVEATANPERRLFVAADGAVVTVEGSVLALTQGTKGARISVIEGAATVAQTGSRRTLLAGEQLTTHRSIEPAPIPQEIAWSQQSDRYQRLLAQSDALRRQIDGTISLPAARYSPHLLEQMPESTTIYLTIPNLATTLAEADRLLAEQLSQSPELNAWWAEQQKSQSNGRTGIRDALDFVRKVGPHLGQEIAFGVTPAIDKGTPESVLLLADLRDRQGLRAVLEQGTSQGLLSHESFVLVENPLTSPAVAATSGQDRLYLWLGNDVLAASPNLETLRQLALRQQNPARRTFLTRPFGERIASLYREGVGFLVAADFERMITPALNADKGAAVARQLGLTDLRHVVIEVKEKDGRAFNRAVVGFQPKTATGQTHGIPTWLAAPGPMGSLDFISPNAALVAAFVVRQPTAIVDDLLATLQTGDPKAWESLRAFQIEHGIDIREDLAAALGGEYAFALDGPLLPIPSWKAIFEVSDPVRLQQTLGRVVDLAHQRLQAEGKLGFSWKQEQVGELTFHQLKSLDYALEANYVYAHGYLIAGPSRTLVERALRARTTGVNLPHAAAFRASLPEDQQANFSALLYHHLDERLGAGLGMIAKPLAKRQGAEGPSTAPTPLAALLTGKAGLAYLYAYPDRMVFSINTEDGPMSIRPADFLLLPSGRGSGGLGGFLRGLGN
ncbi:MAG: FecR domain-containing protein [Blastocatellia bacterium]